ncbi:MAG: Stk1 family PASTA domain-containing Ser/Thr kinase [Lachnospiraceae bacterium]|jgi:serine/threonine protein kinase
MLRTGDVLGKRYELVGKIGSGGMADVYKAKDHKLNRYVAVKVMKAEFNNDESFVRKFRREAQAAAGLANPNIVNVYDVGEDQGNYYIVMELVEGITLKEYITKKRELSVREATSIAIQVCMGLAAAHSQGIVHRDIKPQNIIISTDGKVKVTDFGIARAASSNTISANVMGSVHYSSPEQVRGGYSDAKSDIYSLGITLYEMVTGRVPFDGETTVAIAIKHLQDEMDPPSKYVPNLPFSLEQIIYKCTQKSPDRRYNSVNEVIDDLKRSLTDPNGHFVMLTPLSDHAQTVTISATEMQAIKDGVSRKHTPSAKINEKYVDDDIDDDDDDDGEGISSRLEKAMTIGGFIIGAIIICLLIFFIGRAAGLFKGGKEVESSVDVVESSDTSEDNADKIEAPNLLGHTREEAQSMVQSLGIGIKYAGEEASSEYPEGQICRQDPAAGTMLDPNSTITFYISSSAQKNPIPTVVGMSTSDAISTLQNAGYTNITTIEQPSETSEAGIVIAVSPTEGASVELDTQITLTVSSGPQVESQPEGTGEPVEMPQLRGLARDDAVAILEGMGMIVKTEDGYSASLNEGDVVSQSVQAGEMVNAGSTITLTINTGNPDDEGTAEATQTGGWKTNVRLDGTSDYTGGAYRLTLTQNVNGQDNEIIVSEGTDLQFPFDFKYDKGAEGVETGTVYLYKESGGNYVRIARWTVPFSA